MYKKIIGSALAFLLMTQTAFGFCTWGIVPPGRTYEPVDATEVFIHFEDGVQTMVIKPEFQGNATDFAIVYPTPSKPQVEEAPAQLFEQLNNATNPLLPTPMFNIESAFDDAGLVASGKSVTVVEEKQVGDFDVTILTATDSSDLVDWLQENDYNYSASDTEKMEYYVNQSGFYFIALKVRIDYGEQKLVALPAFTDDLWFGELSPIEFTFAADVPQLPMRTLKSNMPTMTFDLYTVADHPWYIPGVDTIYADVVDKDLLAQVADLARYDVAGQWIVRQEVKFEPKNSNQDVFLHRGNQRFPRVSVGDQVRISPKELDTQTGILPGTRGTVAITHNVGAVFTRSMTIGSWGSDVQTLQQLLNAHGFTVAESGPGSAGSESKYFGTKTKTALTRFQNFYCDDILTPVGLSHGTGYFGPSTIKFFASQ